MKTKIETNMDRLVSNAQAALKEFEGFTQEQVDKIVYEMTLAGIKEHAPLAKMAVEETGRGIYEDKIIKNLFATESVYNNVKHQKTVGVINDNAEFNVIEIADPIGVLAGVTPVTNPTSTTMFKSIIALKSRNPIIFGFHPSAQKCSARSAEILRDAAIKAGAPKNCIQWIEEPSLDATSALMNHEGVSLVLATGGGAMVRAAYSTGKPALGVGPGNVPAYVHSSADIAQAANDLMLSKTFDNGMICASEQAVIVDAAVSKEFEHILSENNCHFLNEAEIKKVTDFAFPPANGKLNAKMVGQSAFWIAKEAGVTVDKNTKILIAKVKEVSDKEPLTGEKLSPILAYLTASSTEDGMNKAVAMLEKGGLGHTAVIHAKDEAVIAEYSRRVKVGRIIVNSPSSQGGIGDVYNHLVPSLTLGCGSYGRNSTTANVSALQLINVKRQAKRRINMQWFKVPPQIYFYENSILCLSLLPDINRVFIVTDPSMVEFGYVDKVVEKLNAREKPVKIMVFSQVQPDPTIQTIRQGLDEMNRFKPDAIIALGGGSPMDAAKGMWLFYECPDISFDDTWQKFLDIEKRTFRFPELGRKAKMICIPTTSGTGSETTAFSVISDSETNMKYPLADYQLTPDVAIIDAGFTMSLPKSITADTGMDVLTHALEAYVSIMASDYTDALAIKAIQMVFDYLPRAYRDGATDPEAREKMHNASAMAGMAFTNAFLGVNHSLAHKLGAAYHVPHGRANSIILPHVIRYNGTKPTKFPTFPRANKFIADQKYADVAKMLGLPAKTPAEGVESLAKAVTDLAKSLDITPSLKVFGIDEKDFLAGLDSLADKAFHDQCTTANPRYPLVTELAELYKQAYYGK